MADLLDRPVRELFREASRGATSEARENDPIPPPGRGKGGRSRAPAPSGGVEARREAGAAADADAAAEILGAAFALLVREAVPMMEKLGTPLLAAALREERPWAAVAGLLADVATESLVAEAQGDPLAEALAASSRRRRELL